MGLAARLNFAFFTVIGIMLATHVGVQIFMHRTVAIDTAKGQVQAVIKELVTEIGDGQSKGNVKQGEIPARSEALAERLASDPAFAAAYAARDRSGVAAAINDFKAHNAMSGFVAVFDSQGNVFYSGDSPNSFNYKPNDMREAILEQMRSGNVLFGPGAPTATGTVCLIGMVPIKTGNAWSGMVGVCEPLNSQFLIGLQQKVKLSTGTHGIEALLFSIKDGAVTANTPGVLDDPFFNSLQQKGIGVIDDKGDFERNGRYWTKFRFNTSKNEPLAYILVGAPMPDEKKFMLEVIIEAIASLAAAVVLAMMFSAGIAGRMTNSVRFLVQRAKDLASQKQNLPPLDGLTNEFRELGEQMDTAVTGTRLSIKNLQSQSTRHQDELLEKQKLVEEANSKVEAINRQLSIQNKQLSEVSKQINQASSQSVLLQQKLSSVLQISTEGFLILDAYGNVIAANPAVLNWLGMSEAEVAGRYCYDLVRKPGEPQDNGNFGAFSMHNSVPGELINQFFPEGIIYQRNTDKQVDLLVHLQPIMTDDATIQGYIMVLRDKTLHSEASRLRNEMVSMLQDAIRVPLATAESKWGRVLSTTRESNNSQLGNSLVDLHLTYQQLLGVVDSLLMMHTGIVPASPVIREQISVARLIGECLEHCAQTARDHQVMLDFKTATGLPTTGVDEHLVRDAMMQLLDKMVSVTAPGGRVRVESSAKNNEIRTSIFSSGPALPAEDVEEMFAGFIQGKHTEESYSQRLSMYLVRNNIERIGGRIWAESDRGTYIYIVLPIQ